jgi:hypothetical protein
MAEGERHGIFRSLVHDGWGGLLTVHAGKSTDARAGLEWVDIRGMGKARFAFPNAMHDEPTLVAARDADQLGHRVDSNQNRYTRASASRVVCLTDLWTSARLS